MTTARCCSLVVLFVVLGRAAVGAGPETAAPAGPLEVAAAQTLFRLETGLRIEIVAHEPQVIDPVAARFDERGRLWVVEMRDYPHGPAAGEPPQSQIKILDDRDHDGVFETATVFADQLLFATGLQPWRGGVIVTLAGAVLYLRDTDGDSRADLRETWYTGFAEENSQLRANHPQLGLDHHVYISNGLRGGTVIDPRRPDAQPVPLNGKDFRFHPETFAYEALTGMGQFGLTFDDVGHRYVCSNRNPLRQIVIEDYYLQRNPRFAPPAVAHDVAKAGEESRIYPLSRAWTTSNLHAGQFTAACGVLVFRGNGLQRQHYGNGFTCDPTGNLVHREVPREQGAVFVSQPPVAGEEFLASPDEWFRPVNLCEGPDGALYVLDMYRAVIEHPQFMPDELKTRPDLLLGKDRGRIWRITAHDDAPARTAFDLAALETAALARLLEHPNAWQRETAARLLFERRDPAAVDALRQLALQGATPAARIHALWALEGGGAADAATLRAAMQDASADVRETAVSLAEPRFAADPQLRKATVALAHDDHPRVRFRVALSLTPVQNEAEVAALRTIAVQAPEDEWTRHVVALASGERSIELVQSLLNNPPWAGREPAAEEVVLLTSLLSLAVSQADDAQAQSLLQAVCGLVESEAKAAVAPGLIAVAQGARRRTSLAKLLAAAEPATRQRGERVLSAAAQDASNSSLPLDQRQLAIELLAESPAHAAALAELALGRSPTEVRTAAIQALARQSSLDAWQQFVKQFAAESPAIRTAILNALLQRPDRVRLLLDGLRDGLVRPGEIPPAQANRLTGHGDAEIREQAKQLLAAAIPADRQQVLADYQPVLKRNGDAQRGRQVFTKNCATCHRIGDLGVNVAPDISDSRVKTAEQLLTDILQPNRAIDNNYIGYVLVTHDGQTFTGILTSETTTSVTMRQAEGKDVVVTRDEIEELRSTGVSLMPEGLERTIPAAEMADLLSFIKNWRYLDGRTPLGGE